MKDRIIQIAGAVVIVALGALIGTSFTPGAWYEGLTKPFFTPARWVFGPVWSVLYAIIGWVGARKFLYGGARGLWAAQMVVNFLWTPVFFGMQMPLAALAVIAVLWSLILAFILREWRADRISALLFLPYLAWVSLATALNAAIVLLN
ncbi:TspO/MBR family protein [Szabonella alba]|uniref:Tryptophan-rich sensory protein n=1 Tax=Szabonella alba TaxID=2804194 RepID=A0A8K0Y1N7_9RHOB|nr:TspO/MBR family protein [Szabonella alba]MBL4918062.1 tryptophan-rich sensory protein [Szabonella alba]